jgi:DNA polymerase
MTTNKTAAVFLKEMGITEWQLRDHLAGLASEEVVALTSESAAPTAEAPLEAPVSPSQGMWWFYGDQPAGEAELLFQNMLRVLGLSQQQWSWKKPGSKFNELEMPPENFPLVAVALGVRATQALTGERDSLAELRGAILTISQEGTEDIPVIATFDLAHLLARPKDKMLVWQDLLLAKSVLQSF